jgi:hypothetical protein
MQTNDGDTVICFLKSLITNHMIPTSPLRKLKLLTRSTPSWVSFNRFPHFTKNHKAFASFLLEAKWTFRNFSKTHHKLGSSRAMPSHLGGLPSKSNKYFTSA